MVRRNWFIGLYFLSDGLNDESINQFIKYFLLEFTDLSSVRLYQHYISVVLGKTLELLKKVFIWKIPLSNFLAVIVLQLLFLARGISLYELFIGSPGVFENKLLAIPAVLFNSVRYRPTWRGTRVERIFTTGIAKE